MLKLNGRSCEPIEERRYTWCCQLAPDRHTALAVFFLGFAGLEPQPGDLPDLLSAEFLPDTMPRWPVTHRYFNDGGTEFPARTLIHFRRTQEAT